MSRSRIAPELRRIVAIRSGHRCAYCLTNEQIAGGYFTLDHIIPLSLGGTTTSENLCLACWDCNLIKGSRIAGLDPDTDIMVPLFHPYKQRWNRHFSWQAEGLLIVGLSPTGRATVNILKLNRPPLANARRFWIQAGWHPPE
ncbi:MAG: HNH endonuclease [Rhodobacteraceae bacterium]|nr:HNH endonuclease [Paracoccaceae bacterium]